MIPMLPKDLKKFMSNLALEVAVVVVGGGDLSELIDLPKTSLKLRFSFLFENGF